MLEIHRLSVALLDLGELTVDGTRALHLDVLDLNLGDRSWDWKCCGIYTSVLQDLLTVCVVGIGRVSRFIDWRAVIVAGELRLKLVIIAIITAVCTRSEPPVGTAVDHVEIKSMAFFKVPVDKSCDVSGLPVSLAPVTQPTRV